MALMLTIALACNILYGQYVWIEKRDSIPGGPGVYFLENTTWWVNTLGTCAAFVATLMSDGLLVSNILFVDQSWNFDLYL